MDGATKMKALGWIAAATAILAAGCDIEEDYELSEGFRQARELGFGYAYEVVGEVSGRAGDWTFSYPLIEAGSGAIRKPDPEGETRFVGADAMRGGSLEGKPDPNNNIAVVLFYRSVEDVCASTLGRAVYRRGGRTYVADPLDVRVESCRFEGVRAQLSGTAEGEIRLPDTANSERAPLSIRFQVRTIEKTIE